MKNKTFMIMLCGVLVLCIAATFLHLAYIIYAYEHCSIIEFIAGELY